MTPQKKFATFVPCLFAVVVAAGCASTKVLERQQIATGPLPRPNNILVYYFAATPEEAMAADPALVTQQPPNNVPLTDEQIHEGRQLGIAIANELATDIQQMGLPAQAVPVGTVPRMNDIVIKGYLLSVQAGSETKRLAIGFGAGGSGLTTAVEGFQMTPQGLRKVGSGTLQSGGGKGPGGAVGVATLLATGNPAGLIVSTGMKVYGEASGRSKLEGRAQATAKEIAERIKPRFQEQGWIR